MKALTILAVISGIIFLFFVAKAEKSLIIKGDEAAPTTGLSGISKTLLDKVGEIKSKISGGGEIGNSADLKPVSTDNIIVGAKNFISGAVDKITETIKTPIEDKVRGILCPKD